MSKLRERSGWQIVAALVMVIFMPLGLYAGGYFTRSTALGYGQSASMRAFRTPLETQIFQPAAKLEGYLHGYRVTLICLSPPECS